MSNSLRHLSWVFSLVLHIVVLVGGAYVSTGTHVKINLDKRVYQVDLVGPANKGKPGAKSAPRLAAAGQEAAPKKTSPKDVPSAKTAEKKPAKKAAPVEDSKKAIPLDTANATKEEPKKEEPKKEEPKKEAPKKEEPKKEEPKKEAPKKEDSKKDDVKKDDKKADAKQDAPKKDKADDGKSEKKDDKKQSKEDILAEALGDVGKQAKTGKGRTGAGSDGSAKGDPKGTSKDALADALADAGREVSGRGSSGDGTSDDGDGEGQASGTLEEWYASQVIKVVRQNWRFPRLSNVVLATTVELRLGPDGEIVSSRLKNGSGRSDFDASVMRAIEDTKRLPALPEGLGPDIVITFYNTENE